MQPIVLAPAGTRGAVTAACRCGADAVYLGAQHFNARRNAENFDTMSLPETVRFCHERGVQVFVTVNTLVTDAERGLLIEEADLVAASGADAVIIQDPFVMRLFRERYPELPRHASTQTVVHDLDGAKYLEELGYDTIVLARELTLKEMEHICSHITARAEAFIHGAHCMSVSGACYLSAMLGGRSGNRGLCAQPCRLDFTCNGDDHALSLKDMSLLHHAREMAEAGVGTFKIEGRMKRPEYVAAVVTACRKAMAGESWDEEELKSIFSRSGFTDGYLVGKRDRSMYGYRTKEDVVGAEKVLKGLAARYEKEVQRIPIRMSFAMDAGKSCLAVSDGVYTVEASAKGGEEALHRPLDEESAEKNLTKTGGTQYYVNSFEATIAPGLTMSAAALNALRREGIEKLNGRRGAAKVWEKKETPLRACEKRRRDTEPVLWARFAKPESLAELLPECESFEKVLLPVRYITEEHIEVLRDKLVGELPALLWPTDEAAMEEKLHALKAQGLREVYTENIYAIPLCRRVGLTLRGGAGLNILNTEALRHYEEEGLASLTASFELEMKKIKALGGEKPLGIVAYGRLPLMRFRNCPLRAHEGCGGPGEFYDRRGTRFPFECGEKKYTTMLNSVPLHIAERDLRGLDYALLYFTDETAAECRRVIEDYKLRRKSTKDRTGGLYYRELL